MNPVVQNALIMLALLVPAVVLIQIVMRRIAGKGMVLTLSALILSIVVIDCELAFIVGQIGITPLNIALTFGPGISLTLALIYALYRIIVVPVKALTETTTRLAVGDLQSNVTFSNKNEIGVLATSLGRVIDYQREMARIANQIAQGDLRATVQLKSAQDEMGNAFKTMVEQLNTAFQQVAENARVVDEASRHLAIASQQAGAATGQIAATIQEVAQGTNQQTESINQTGQSVNEMVDVIKGVAQGSVEQSAAVDKAAGITGKISSAIVQVTENTKAGTKNSQETMAVARSGAETVTATVQGMEAIQTKVRLSSQKVKEMGDRSAQIGVIVETIEDIASQTNLLALNAAIEAARAGEHGKGFAVVADEVRKLAERASSSTREVSQLVKGIESAVNEAISAMDEGAQEVDRGVIRANEAGQALNRILNAIEDMNRQVGNIATAAEQIDQMSNDLVLATDSVSVVVDKNHRATQQMRDSASTVVGTIENIAVVSRQNEAAVEDISASAEEVSAQVEEVTAAAQSLADMAHELQQVVGRFKFTGGQDAPAAKPAAQPVPSFNLREIYAAQPAD